MTPFAIFFTCFRGKLNPRGLVAGLVALCLLASGAGAGEKRSGPAAKDKTVAKDKKEKGSGKKLSHLERFLKDAPMKLDGFAFSRADLAECSRLAAQAKTPEERLQLALIAARYWREYAGRPDTAAAQALPFIFPAKTVDDWEKESARLTREAKKEGKTGETTAPGQESQGSDAPGAGAGATTTPAACRLAPLPPAADWELTPANAAAAVEVAACLADAGQLPEALAVIARVGTDFADASRVIAAELAGDVNARNAAYERAIEFYRYGIGWLDKSLGTEKPETRAEDGNYEKEYSEYEKELRARLERKQAAAQRKLEADQYGPDWVLYRDATRADWERHDPAGAYLLYQKLIKEYPDTVYADAARCYAVECLFRLVDDWNTTAARKKRTQANQVALSLPQMTPAPAERVEARLGELERQAARTAEVLARAARLKVPGAILARLKKRLADLESQAKALRTVPLGEAAAKAAEKAASAFLEQFPASPYCGETLLARADHYFCEHIDVTKARECVAKAREWFVKAAADDDALKAIAVPDAAAKVAAPPAEAFGKDSWGNFNLAPQVPGAVFNIRTCRWHFDELWSRAELLQGFLHFVDNDMEAALACFEKATGLNHYQRELTARELPNSLDRLRVAIEIGGFQEETIDVLKKINDRKLKTVLLLGDFYGVNEMPDMAIRIFTNVLRGNCRKLSHLEEYYARYSLAWAYQFKGMYQTKGFMGNLPWDDAAVRCLEVFLNDKQARKSPVGVIALSRIGQIYKDQFVQRKESRAKAIEVWELIMKEFPKTAYAADAKYRYGQALWSLEDSPEQKAKGEKVLRQIIKDTPDSREAEFANGLLEQKNDEVDELW